MSSKKPIKSKYLKNIYNSYCKRVYPPLVTLMCVLIVFFLAAIITRDVRVFLIFPFPFLGIMAWLFIGFVEVNDYQEDGIELLTKYSKIKKLYKNKSIPSSIKLLLNLNWAFNYEDNDNIDSDDYNTWLDSIIDILTIVKENRDVIPWVLHSIDNAGIDIDSLLPLALNIYNDPDAYKVKESYTQVSKQLYEATEAIENGIEEFNDSYSKIVKARAFKKVDELSKQKFNSITEIKPVKHVDNKRLM